MRRAGAAARSVVLDGGLIVEIAAGRTTVTGASVIDLGGLLPLAGAMGRARRGRVVATAPKQRPVVEGPDDWVLLTEVGDEASPEKGA